MSGGTTAEKTATDDRYRALRDASSAIADQPTVKAVLQSLRGVLSATCDIHGAHLYVLDNERESLRVLDFDREADAPPIKTDAKISRIGAAARVLDEQKPVFLPDVSQEMLKHPELAPFAAESVGRATYVFPVSTAQQRYGILVVTKDRGQEFVAEDVELLGSLASHVAVALECALARDRAEQYQRQLASERDRLRLVLEINNHVAKLDINDVLRSASASIGSYFGSDFASFWVLKEETGQLRTVLQDFPGGKGFLPEFASADLTAAEFEKIRTRQADIWSVEDINKLPANLADPLRASNKTAAREHEARSNSGGSLQLRVLRLGLLQDGDVGIGVLPKG